MNVATEQLEPLLKSGKLKYVTRNESLYEYSDLILNEKLNEDWKKNRSSFSAKKYWVEPNIKPGSIFKVGTYGDVWIRFNTPNLQACGNEIKDCSKFDTLRLIVRKGNWQGKDMVSREDGVFWENYWSDLVMDLTDKDWESEGPKLLKEGLSDEQLYRLWENPPLGKTDEGILELLNNGY